MTTATPEHRTCALCRHSSGSVPMMCTLHLRAGEARLAVPLRAEAGPCGPEGAFWQPSAAIRPLNASATILQFPQAHRVSA